MRVLLSAVLTQRMLGFYIDHYKFTFKERLEKMRETANQKQSALSEYLNT